MSPQAGSRLGPYELQAPIGAGGMGEVWRGKDTRLDRSVAIKILPAGFAQDDERRQRFEREAKTISSLNHPHICTLFDVGHEGDAHFLVMELLEGESLADRLQKGPLPLDQVVKFGAQVAEALSRRAQAGHRPPRPQARQRDAHEGRREAPRLRPRPPRRRTRRRLGLDGASDGSQAAHQRGNGARHVPVHGARAARGRGGRPAHRHLRARSAPLRDGDGAARVRRQVEDEPDRGDPLDPAAADLVDPAGDAAGARPRREEVPGEGSRTTAGRAPTTSRASCAGSGTPARRRECPRRCRCDAAAASGWPGGSSRCWEPRARASPSSSCDARPTPAVALRATLEPPAENTLDPVRRARHGPVRGWKAARLRRHRRRRQQEDLGPRPLRHDGPPAARDLGGVVPLLVARRPVSRLLRRREAEADRPARRVAEGDRGGSFRPRRELGQGRRDPVLAEPPLGDSPASRQRRDAHARHPFRSREGEQPPLASLPSGRQALPLFVAGADCRPGRGRPAHARLARLPRMRRC